MLPTAMPPAADCPCIHAEREREILHCSSTHDTHLGGVDDAGGKHVLVCAGGGVEAGLHVIALQHLHRVIGTVVRTDRRLGAKPSDCTLAAQQMRMRMQVDVVHRRSRASGGTVGVGEAVNQCLQQRGGGGVGMRGTCEAR